MIETLGGADDVEAELAAPAEVSDPEPSFYFKKHLRVSMTK